MKLKHLKPIETLTCTLLLASLLGCGRSMESTPEPKEAAKEAAPAAVTATPVAAPPAASSEPVAAPPAAAPPPAANTALAAGAIRYDALPTGSKMKIAGESTMHDWTMESVILSGFIEADAKFPESALTDAQAAKPKAEVSMPVRSFKSNSKKMDSVMQENMKEPEFKKIEYRLIELKPKSPAGATGPLQFDAVGALTITGTTVTHTMSVTIEKKDGKLKVTGTTPLKFTDYKMKPPEIKILGMSAISVGDELKLSFEWSLAPKAQ